MARQEFRFASTLSFTLAALLTIPSASIAQTQTGAGDRALRPTAAVSSSTFHFTDGASDTPSRLTTDAAGNFYVSATIKSTAHASGFAILKYDSPFRQTNWRNNRYFTQEAAGSSPVAPAKFPADVVQFRG